MHKDKLRENLGKLRSELASTAESIDKEVHDLLQGMADDLEQVLGDAPVPAHSGKERLEEVAIKFETDHPRLAFILCELADTLSKLGI